MANKTTSSLPKVISKANKEISTLLENDIQKESALLKDLVDQVLKSNLEVKKRNNLRITETKRKLSELDDQIEGLNLEIDLVDRETVIQQLNEMIDAENKIFNARQEIRYFDNENLPERIHELDRIYQALTTSISTEGQEQQFRNLLLQSNQHFFEKQLDISNEINQTMETMFDEKKEFIATALNKLNDIKATIAVKEQLLHDILLSTMDEVTNILINSTSHFSSTNDDKERLKELTLNHNQKMNQFKENTTTLKEQYEAEKELIIKTYNDFANNINSKLESSNEAQLDIERKEKEQLDEKLRQIQLQMMKASQQGQIEKAGSLLKEYESLQKNTKSKTTNKVEKIKTSSTQKERNSSIKKLQDLEQKYILDIQTNEMNQGIQLINFEESKVLFKMQTDHQGLKDMYKDTKEQFSLVRSFLNNQIEIRKELSDIKLDLRLKELDILKDNEIKELELINVFQRLLNQIKETEQKRIAVLNQNTNTQNIINLEYEYRLKQAVLDIKLNQETNEIEKRILKKRNETLIKNEKLKEELNSDIIYQESQIKIAQKEHELQLIKVRSLYENERSLAEEQVERINLGVQVNDTFVKTTLKNQMLFATQQINCAESEFEIRLESIGLTHSQEVKYANKKIEYYKQKYEYDKNKIRKELDDKIEDLNYKLLLFTEDKERKEIQEKIDTIRSFYETKIQAIEDEESKDKDILRYEKVIEDANSRQQQAINEALALKEQTSSSFEQLLEATKSRYQQIEETDQTEETKGLLPLLNSSAISSADQRLQQAIKEADELYAERVIDPERIIKETKQQIIDLTKADESEQFINEQKELKKQIVKRHKEQSDLLLSEKQEKLVPILNHQVQDTVSLETPYEEIEIKMYRTIEELTPDYANLIHKERQFHAKQIKELVEYRRQKFMDLVQLEKRVLKSIKVPIKPYAAFLKAASKDFTKQKNAVVKDFKKKLSKKQKTAKKHFIVEI